MIRLNVFMRLNDLADKEKVVALAQKLVEASRKDKGCVAYDVFASETLPRNLMICETWKSVEDLDAHGATEHFQRIVPQLEELAPMKAERFDF